jgi:hypothetical protein
MRTIYEIPLKPSNPTIFAIDLDGTTYNFRFTYSDARDGAWILDVADASLNLILAGIPLVSGVDLLGQYRYLGFSGGLYVTTDRGTGEVPGFGDFGSVAHLFYVSDNVS